MPTPIDVTVIPASPRDSKHYWVLAIEHDEFEDGKEAICDYAPLGPLIAWRFETYCMDGRTYTCRVPIGQDDEPPGTEWTTPTAHDRATYDAALVQLAQAVAAYDARGHRIINTEEN